MPGLGDVLYSPSKLGTPKVGEYIRFPAGHGVGAESEQFRAECAITTGCRQNVPEASSPSRGRPERNAQNRRPQLAQRSGVTKRSATIRPADGRRRCQKVSLPKAAGFPITSRSMYWMNRGAVVRRRCHSAFDDDETKVSYVRGGSRGRVSRG